MAATSATKMSLMCNAPLRSPWEHLQPIKCRLVPWIRIDFHQSARIGHRKPHHTRCARAVVDLDHHLLRIHFGIFEHIGDRENLADKGERNPAVLKSWAAMSLRASWANTSHELQQTGGSVKVEYKRMDGRARLLFLGDGDRTSGDYCQWTALTRQRWRCRRRPTGPRRRG